MSAQRRLIGFIWPFAAVVLVQLLLAGGSLYTMAAVRAYVGGESFWSKGQKDAIYFLHRYIDTGADRYITAFNAAIAVPLADRTARIALEQTPPDIEAATAGLIGGGNHPDDVPGMIWFYRNFRGMSYLMQAVDFWAQADPYIVNLDTLAQAAHREIRSGSVSPGRLEVLKAEIDHIDVNIMPLARKYSQSLGEGSRVMKQTLIAANVVSAIMLIVLALWRTARLLAQHRAAERALEDERQRSAITLASIGDAVISTDAYGLVDYVNPAAEKLIGWSGAEARGKPLRTLFRLVDEETGEETPTLKSRLIDGGSAGAGAAMRMLVRPDMTSIAVSLSVSPLTVDGAAAGAVLVLHDMTAERDYIARLSWQATHDALTNLANRREFEQRMERAIGHCGDGNGSHALMFIDIDQFKIINDTCGHAAGDQLLRQVSAALAARLHGGDLLARLGGDEFGVLLAGRTEEQAAAVAEELRRAVQELDFTWNGRPFSISASIGLVDISDATITVEDALRTADVACYMAKEKGRNRVHVHHVGDTELERRFGEMAWVQRIRQAIEDNRFTLHAQEIAPLAEDDRSGPHVELLLRLRDENGRLVLPASFIPAAERYGLMPLIDRWVVKKAFSLMELRRDAGVAPLATMAINLSGASLGEEAFADFVHDQLAARQIDAETICFEITETSAIANLDSAGRLIAALKQLGCRFALDDFGTGMSSFAYLKHLPVDYLKIDGSFVRDMLHNRIDRAMVEMIAHIGQVTGKRTIAEFVEDAETIAALKDIGIDYAQGHAIGRPKPFDGLTGFAPRPALPVSVAARPVTPIELIAAAPVRRAR